MENSDRFKDFINHCLNNNVKIRTINRYIYILSKIPQYLFDSLETKEDIEVLEGWMKEYDRSHRFSFYRSYAISYYALKKYLIFLDKEKLTIDFKKPTKKHTERKGVPVTDKAWDAEDLQQFIQFSRYKKVSKLRLSPKSIVDEIDAGYSMIEKDESDADRDYIAVKTLVITGMRCSEALSMKFKDIDSRKETMLIKGKTGYREVSIPKNVIFEIKEYVDKYKIQHDRPILKFPRPRDEHHEKRNTFINMYGKKKGIALFKNWAYLYRFEYMVKKVGEVAMAKKKLHPHAFRHSLAMLLKKENVPLDKIQVTLGHKSIQTTKIYAETTVDDIKEDHQKILKKKGLL